MYYSRPPAGLLVWRGCLVSSLPPHLFSLCPPPVAPLQLFYGLIFGRRPEVAPWGPPLPPACPSPSLQPELLSTLTPPPRGPHILCPSTARRASVSESLRPAQGGSCPWVRGPQLGPRAGLPTVGTGQAESWACQPQPTWQAPGKLWKRAGPLHWCFWGQRIGGRGRGKNRYQVSGTGLSRAPWNVQEGKEVPGLTCFSASYRLENLLSAERPSLAENPRDSPSS